MLSSAKYKLINLLWVLVYPLAFLMIIVQILSWIVRGFIKKNKQITHIAMIHCETSSGILNPLADIGNLCKKYKKKLSTNVYIKGKRYGRKIKDTFFTIGMSFFESILLRKFLWDINAQPNIIHKRFFKSLNKIPLDFSLDLFFYYNAKKQNLKIFRFPVKFYKRKFGYSHWNISLKNKVKFIKRTIKYSLKLRKQLEN